MYLIPSFSLVSIASTSLRTRATNSYAKSWSRPSKARRASPESTESNPRRPPYTPYVKVRGSNVPPTFIILKQHVLKPHLHSVSAHAKRAAGNISQDTSGSKAVCRNCALQSAFTWRFQLWLNEIAISKASLLLAFTLTSARKPFRGAANSASGSGRGQDKWSVYTLALPPSTMTECK